MDVSYIVLDEQNLYYANHLVSQTVSKPLRQNAPSIWRSDFRSTFFVAVTRSLRRMKRIAKPWYRKADSISSSRNG